MAGHKAEGPEGLPSSAQVVARHEQDERHRRLAAVALADTEALSAFLRASGELPLRGYAEDAVLNLIANYLGARTGWVYEVTRSGIRPVGAWQAIDPPAWLAPFSQAAARDASQAPGEAFLRLDGALACALFARALAGTDGTTTEPTEQGATA